MKKILLTLCALLILGVSGAWADVMVKVADYDNYQPWGSPTLISRSSDKLILTTTSTSGVEGLVLQSSGKSDDGYWDRSGNWLLLIPKNTTESTFTITIAAPSGYAITEYSVDLCSWNTDRTYVVTAEDGTSITTSNNTIQTLSLSALSTRTTSITVKANVCTTNNYFTIKNMTVTLTPAPNIPNGDYLINIQKTDATNYNSFIKPSIEQLFTDSYQNVSTAGVFNLTRVGESYDTYYIKELSSGKYLYAVNADKADYDNNGNVTTYGASSSNKYRFHTGTYSETLLKAIDLGDTELPDGDKTAYQWKILPSPISANHLNIIPYSNTKTSLGMWTSSDTYYSFLEPSYGWSQVKFYTMEDATQAYLSYNNVQANLDLAGKAGYPTQTNDYFVAVSGLITVFGGGTYNSTHFSNLKTWFQAYLDEQTVTYPSTNKIYKIYHPTQARYLYAKAADYSTQLTVETDGSAADAIFYSPEEGKFVAYINGFYMVDNKIYNVPGGSSTLTISHYSGHPFGTVLLKGGGYYYYAHTDNLVYRNTTNYAETSKYWRFEEVTSLPVTISAIGYNSFYCPVDVIVPEGVTAYTCKIDNTGSTLNLFPIMAGSKIPANTGVILEGTANDKVSFTVTSGATPIDENENDFTGTVTTKAKTDGDLVLGYENSTVGFYKYTGDNLAGFKSYISVAKKPAGVKALTFNFLATAIQALQEASKSNVIYDLNGRRVQKAQRGTYIINGKTVIIR